MRRFELTEPRTLEEACLLLSDDTDAKAMAGGTALLTLIKHGLFIPKTLVNLNKIHTASAIDYEPKRGLHIGALTSIFDVGSSPVVRQYYPVLAEACPWVANICIRNMATLGGNLAHGDHQSAPPAALVALDASVELMRRNGTRQMKSRIFCWIATRPRWSRESRFRRSLFRRRMLGAAPTLSSLPVLLNIDPVPVSPC